jgi:hypothetical protein
MDVRARFAGIIAGLAMVIFYGVIAVALFKGGGYLWMLLSS